MKGKVFFLFLVLLFGISVFAYAEIKYSVAIMEFEPKGVEKSDASIISDFFRDYLFSSGHFIVIDRASMETIMKEQNLQQSVGCTSDECAVQIGKMLGVNYTIIGTLGKLGDVYVISARMVSIETAKIEWSKSEKVLGFGEIDNLIQRLVNDLVKTLFKDATVIEPAPKPKPVPQPEPKPAPKTDEYGQVIKKDDAPKPAPVPKVNYKYPDMGIDISYSFWPRQNYFYSTSSTYGASDEWYDCIGHPRYGDFKLGLYWELLYFGIETKRFTFKEDDILECEDETGGYEAYYYTDDWSDFFEISLGTRFAGQNSSRVLMIFWKTYQHSYDGMSGDPTVFKGPGLGLFSQVGVPLMATGNVSPVGFYSEFTLKASYLNMDPPDWADSYDWYQNAICVDTAIGFGAIMKKYGAYILVSYNLTTLLNWYGWYDSYSYTNYDSAELVIWHGISVKLGINFNLRAFKE